MTFLVAIGQPWLSGDRAYKKYFSESGLGCKQEAGSIANLSSRSWR